MKINDSEAVLFIKAATDEGSHIYSQHLADGGPFKTTIVLTFTKTYAPYGPVAEPKPITVFEKAFGINVAYFEKIVIFQQKIRLKGAGVHIPGFVDYMTCNNKECLLPGRVDFDVPVN